MTQQNLMLWLCLSGAALLLCAFVALASGPMQISWGETWQAIQSLFQSQESPAAKTVIIQQVRLPRLLLAIAIGGMLAITGVAMQGLFRNPLADPGIIGVSSGAALGAAVAIVLLGSWTGVTPQGMILTSVPLLAFVTSLLTTWMVWRIGRTPFGTSVTLMLLAGIAISALAGAAMGFLNYYADDQSLRDLSLWTMGSLAGANWQNIGAAFVVFGLFFVLFYRQADALNALLLGENEAAHSGVDVPKVKRRLIIYTAACIGFCVSLSGMIGFIGLVVPHLIRLLSGPNHRTLLPLSALSGAILLVVADTLSRNLMAPVELPVGLITAAIGAPFFIFLLIQQKEKLR